MGPVWRAPALILLTDAMGSVCLQSGICFQSQNDIVLLTCVGKSIMLGLATKAGMRCADVKIGRHHLRGV